MRDICTRLGATLTAALSLACADRAGPRSLAPTEPALNATAQGATYTNVIAFSYGNGIGAEFAVMNPDGRNVVQLSALSDGFRLSDVSPDGTLFAFTNTALGQYGAWVARADGSQRRRLPNSFYTFDGSTHFSPDGRWIVFGQLTSQVQGYFWRAMLVDPLTWTSRQVIPEAVPDPRDFQYEPTWSPNSQEIAFIGPSGLERVRIDGTGRTRIPIAGYECEKPAWSPSGGMFACAGSVAGSPTERTHLFVVNARGRELRVLSSSVDGVDDPTWAPNGRSIVFKKVIGFQSMIFRVAVDGSWERELTRGPQGVSSPVWARVVQVP